MKKLLILLLSITFAINSNAQNTLFGNKNAKYATNDPKYTKGAVPETKGKIVFTEEIDANGQSKEEIFNKIISWANLRYLPNVQNGEWNNKYFYKNYEYATIQKKDKATGTIQCIGNEEMVFYSTALSKDFATIDYYLDLSITDGKIYFKMSNITYLYNFTDVPEKITAEEWISDSKAFNKKGKFITRCAKFRYKTIDLKDELIREISATINNNKVQQQKN